MARWDRRTPWRQGHVLTPETAGDLNLGFDDSAPHPVVVVVSHDCDLAQAPENEPVVEVIVGRRVDSADGNLTHGKNPRRLHLPAMEQGNPIYLELAATARRPVPKEGLLGHQPSAGIVINPNARNILQRWLASRYRRTAFPDAFDRCLDRTRVAKRMAKILEPLGDHIVAVFFDVDEGVEREHEGADDAFTLSIDLLYSTDTDPPAAEAAATQAARAITAAFQELCFDASTNRWHGIELLGCTPISDESLTYAMSLRLKRWNADYISLRSDPTQPIVDE